jgi:hypothetical protein
MRTIQVAINCIGHGKLYQTPFMIAMIEIDCWWSSIQCCDDCNLLFATESALQDQLWIFYCRVAAARVEEAHTQSTHLQHAS